MHTKVGASPSKMGNAAAPVLLVAPLGMQAWLLVAQSWRATGALLPVACYSTTHCSTQTIDMTQHQVNQLHQTIFDGLLKLYAAFLLINAITDAQ